jgi:hypothetical protein
VSSEYPKWLIEGGPVSAPIYLYFHDGMPAWTFTAYDATSFLTKEAAESAIGLVDDMRGLRAAEHKFIPPTK